MKNKDMFNRNENRPLLSRWMFAFMVLILPFAGCTHKEEAQIPSEVLSENLMAEILTDIYLTEGVMIQLEYIQQKETHSGVPYYNMIFQKYGVMRDEFIRSMKFYSEKQELIDRIYDKVIQQLSKEQLEVQPELVK